MRASPSRCVDRDTGQPFPRDGARAIIPDGSALSYRIAATGSVSGQLVLIDRKQGRTIADGQLSSEYTLLCSERVRLKQNRHPAHRRHACG